MRSSLARWGGALFALLVGAAAACSDYGGATEAPAGSGAGGTAGVGQPCTSDAICRAGLGCKSGTCEPCECAGEGGACVLNDECQTGSYCAQGKCAPAGSGQAGAPCTSDADCASGFRCDVSGLSAECKPEGTVDVGGACMTSADCYGGLTCAAGTCSATVAGTPPFGAPGWPGATCTDDPGPTTAYFHVPRGTNDGDFYRLPFPNDVRIEGGKISLAGHPTPGGALLGFDLVQRWIDDLQATADGFSTYPTVYFRFSAPVDLNGTLKAQGAVRWLDVTDPQKPATLPLNWSATTDRNAYICNNWMAIRPPEGATLTAGHTYAVLLMTGVLDASLQPIQVAPDLTALLGPSAPSDPALAAQWPKYQSLRDWASAQNLPVTSILDATVFTVGHPAAVGPKLAAAVAAATAPVVTSWVRCGDAPSPCPQATGDRACGAPDPAFEELHALVTLPIFQQGSEPYAQPSDGGDVALDASGTPQVQRTEQVCMALTVPKGATMPSGGWPVVVYAHGTGGSFRSHVIEGVAKRLASVDDGMGGQVHIAVLGIDQVEHGTRRGSSQDPPDGLFYNFANPLAARGNVLQGAADQMALVRLATGFDLAAGQSPTGAEIKLGPVVFWGHSQGATEGALAMPYTAGVLGAVLSGEGASLMDALVTKKNPVDIADVVPVALEDPKVDVHHPVLALLQNDLGLIDPLNYAGQLVASPAAAADQKHVFQPYGQNDSYAPPVTERTFAIAAQLGEAAAPAGVTPDPIFTSAPLGVPAGGNAIVMGKALTAIVRQYAPGSGYDGHFVAYQNADAEADVDHFLADALLGKVPAVGR